jgi:hypothetical protein
MRRTGKANSTPGIERRRRRGRRTAHLRRLRRSGRPPGGGKGAGGSLFTMKEAAQKRNGRGEEMGRGGEGKKRTIRYVV